MPAPAEPSRVCGLVLAAGGSSRLGRPKQLLPYRGATLLDAVLDTARA
jgi:molybdenum cofactor cytidylyltransferase